MLIKNVILERIRSGEITLIFRRWKRAGVKAGGTQLTQMGVVGVDTVDIVTEKQITEKDAKAAGFASKKELFADLYDRDEDIYRIGVRWLGEDPRIALRAADDLSDAELAEIIAKLDKMDRNSKHGAWTRSYLEVIRDMPATYSGLLANYLGISQADFKPRVRKLKALGLTESLEVGYRLSPRGEKVLEALMQRHVS
ncbi:MAG: ASCH domain-containing protein [Pyrinomonadaceae bacterium]